MPLDEERFRELLRLLDSHPEWVEALQERLVDEKAILRVLEKRAEVRDAVRRQILQEDLLRLPALVEQLVEAQQRTEAQVRELVTVQQRHETQLQEHTRLIQQLIEAQRRTEAQVQELAESQRRTEASDVRRAYLRAQTLRKAGVDATGVVLGEEWADPTNREMAEGLGVEWFIRGDVSDGVRAFQRIQVATTEQV